MYYKRKNNRTCPTKDGKCDYRSISLNTDLSPLREKGKKAGHPPRVREMTIVRPQWPDEQTVALTVCFLGYLLVRYA
jgi:hypothetical protein